MRIDKITPRHIISFCNNLAEPGVRIDTKYTPTVDFKALLKKKKMTQAQLSEKAGVSITSIRSCINGYNVSKTTADKISAALNDNFLFKAADSNGTLSNNGIDDSALSKRLGHSNPSITRRIYTHVNRSADMRAANKIEELLFREDD